MDETDAPECSRQSIDMVNYTGSLPISTGLASNHKRKDKERRDKKRNKKNPAEHISTIPAFVKRCISIGKVSNKKTRRPLGGRLPNLLVESNIRSRPSNDTRSRIGEGPEQAEERLARMRSAVRTLLECVGEDPNREGLLATPARYAKTLLFLTKGYQIDIEDIVNNALFHEGHNEIIIVKNIEIHSLCEHHLVPFTGKMHIGYIPSDNVIGLSKLPRIAEMFSRRLQIQERLTKEVAHAIIQVLNPQGVAVVMESCHLCMVMRGVEKTGTTSITSCVLGCFEKNFDMRNEFMSLVGVNRT